MPHPECVHSSHWDRGGTVTAPSLGHVFIAKDSETTRHEVTLGSVMHAPAPLTHLGPILRPSYEQGFDLRMKLPLVIALASIAACALRPPE